MTTPAMQRVPLQAARRGDVVTVSGVISHGFRDLFYLNDGTVEIPMTTPGIAITRPEAAIPEAARTFGTATIRGATARFPVMLMHRRGSPIWLSERGNEYLGCELIDFREDRGTS